MSSERIRILEADVESARVEARLAHQATERATARAEEAEHKLAEACADFSRLDDVEAELREAEAALTASAAREGRVRARCEEAVPPGFRGTYQCLICTGIGCHLVDCPLIADPSPTLAAWQALGEAAQELHAAHEESIIVGGAAFIVEDHEVDRTALAGSAARMRDAWRGFATALASPTLGLRTKGD